MAIFDRRFGFPHFLLSTTPSPEAPPLLIGAEGCGRDGPVGEKVKEVTPHPHDKRTWGPLLAPAGKSAGGEPPSPPREGNGFSCACAPAMIPSLSLTRGLSFARARANVRGQGPPKGLLPSPRGEGGPRQAFSPAVAGRMRGHFPASTTGCLPRTTAGWPFYGQVERSADPDIPEPRISGV